MHANMNKNQSSSMFGAIRREVKKVSSVKEAVRKLEINIEKGVHDYKTQFLDNKEAIMRFHLVVIWSFLMLYSFYLLCQYSPRNSHIIVLLSVLTLIGSAVMMQTAFIFSKIRNYSESSNLLYNSSTLIVSYIRWYHQSLGISSFIDERFSKFNQPCGDSSADRFHRYLCSLGSPFRCRLLA